jgi:hypothetical protein
MPPATRAAVAAAEPLGIRVQLIRKPARPRRSRPAGPSASSPAAPTAPAHGCGTPRPAPSPPSTCPRWPPETRPGWPPETRPASAPRPPVRCSWCARTGAGTCAVPATAATRARASRPPSRPGLGDHARRRAPVRRQPGDPAARPLLRPLRHRRRAARDQHLPGRADITRALSRAGRPSARGPGIRWPPFIIQNTLRPRRRAAGRRTQPPGRGPYC